MHIKSEKIYKVVNAYKNLTELEVDDNQLGDEGVQIVGMRLGNLIKFSAAPNEIGD
jgi:hypothetical protein